LACSHQLLHGKMFAMKQVRLLAWLLAAIAPLNLCAQKDTTACKSRRDLVGSCRIVHGRLKYYNGTPSFRVWVVGTNRVLGVHEVEVGDNPEYPLMPEKIWSSVGMMDHEIYADFEVCPLSQEKPGAMQVVCIESAKNLVEAPYGGARTKLSNPSQSK